MARKLILLCVISLFCLSTLTVRVLISSRGHLRAGQAALDRGDVDAAIVELGRAARMYAPASPYSTGALTRLREIAEKAEQGGDRTRALVAYRELRSAILSVRSFYTPHADLLAIANARLAVLMAEVEEGMPELAGEPLPARQQWHRRMLARDEAPSVGWSLVAITGSFLLIIGAVSLVRSGLSADGHILARPALRRGAVILLGLLLMLLGLWRA